VRSARDACRIQGFFACAGVEATVSYPLPEASQSGRGRHHVTPMKYAISPALQQDPVESTLNRKKLPL
jgi:hypothetical protein